MKPVEIYTTPICGFCAAAKRLLTKKGVSYTEIDVMRDPSRRGEMMQRANGRRTVPQIFIGGEHIGGELGAGVQLLHAGPLANRRVDVEWRLGRFPGPLFGQ